MARNPINEWLMTSGLDRTPSMPLFPAFSQNKQLITSRDMTRVNVWGLIQTRARAVGLKKADRLPLVSGERVDGLYECWRPTRHRPAHRGPLSTFHHQNLRSFKGPCYDRGDRKSLVPGADSPLKHLQADLMGLGICIQPSGLRPSLLLKKRSERHPFLRFAAKPYLN